MANAAPGGPIALLGMHAFVGALTKARLVFELGVRGGGGSRVLGQAAMHKGLRPPTCQVAL